MALLFIIGFMIGDLIWLRAADRRLRAAKAPSVWRGAIGLFTGAMFGYVALGMTPWSQPLRRSQGPLSEVAHATVYLWHFTVLPVLMLVLLVGLLRRRSAARAVRRFSSGGRAEQGSKIESPEREPSKSQVRSEPGRVGPVGPEVRLVPSARPGRHAPAPIDSEDLRVTETSDVPPHPAPTRRQVITAAALAVPPFVAYAAGNASIRTLYGRRLRSFNLTIPQLPRQLDGMTIAHVSDTHIGKFFHPDRLPAIAEDINKLDADFIVFTGDLIDLALDDLHFGVDFLRSLKSRCGMAICEGNHDLMEDREGFRDLMRDTGLPFISYGNRTLAYTSRSGTSYPVQFLATSWNPVESYMIDNVHTLRRSMHADAFPILLAHHPHCFDAAAEEHMPLILSGHTHGGQIMLNDQTGLGKLRFRYTSGLYHKPGSSLIVNNGLGNWFPIRINAPAELIHITLHAVS